MSPKVGADDLIAAGATAADLDGLPREELPPKDGEPRKRSQAQVLVDLAREAEVLLFHTPDGTGYAVFPVARHFETWAVRSRGFRRWLARLYYDAIGKPPSAQPMSDALNLLEAKVQFDGREAPVFARVGRAAEATYLDLANDRWEAVEITAAGWRVVGDPPVRFRRARGIVALPAPTFLEPGSGSACDCRGATRRPPEAGYRPGRGRGYSRGGRAVRRVDARSAGCAGRPQGRAAHAAPEVAADRPGLHTPGRGPRADAIATGGTAH